MGLHFIAGVLLLVYRWIPSEFSVADADSRRWENDRETWDSKIVRDSDFNPALIEHVRPPCSLINDASPWMEYCAEQNPKTTSHGSKGRRAKKSPIRSLVRWEQPAQHRKSFSPHENHHQGAHLTPSSTSVPDGSDRSGSQEGPWPQLFRKRRSGARNDGQLSTGGCGFRGICNRDRAAVGLVERAEVKTIFDELGCNKLAVVA